MKKKSILIVFFIIFLLSFLGCTNTNNTTNPENANLSENELIKERVLLGYCPTMKEKAFELKQGNTRIELIEFGSAFKTLQALNNKKIDQALIGRKAQTGEINDLVKENILKSGYTLVSNQKKLVNLSDLEFFEIESYLDKKIVKKLLPNNKINYLDSKNQIQEKINQGKIVLINWEDWEDEFGLIVVVEGNEKVKDFRGEFLYFY